MVGRAGDVLDHQDIDRDEDCVDHNNPKCQGK